MSESLILMNSGLSRGVQRCAEVEVEDLKGAELGAFPGENAVNHELD
jgi:hypothetical protein